MAQTEQLALLKTDLGMYGTLTAGLRSYLTVLLVTAADLIRREGVELNETSIEDDGFVASYAAWLYRKRASQTDASLPRSLRWQLNMRKMGRAMGREEASADDL